MTELFCYCLGCRCDLGVAEKIFTFYIPNSSNKNDVQFVIKPEIVQLLRGETNAFQLAIRNNNNNNNDNPVNNNSKKKKNKSFENGIYCKNCDNKLGNVTNFGPNNGELYSIGHEKVFIGKNPTVLQVKEKWHIQLQTFKNISNRNPETFSQSVLHINTTELLNNEIVSPTKIIDLKTFKFSWKTLIKSQKKPSIAQIHATIESIIRDTIVVMPTGTGKSK